MLVIKIVDEKVLEQFEAYLISEDLGYTKNGGEFEIPAADPVGWTIGRRYEYYLNKSKENEQVQLPQEEKVVNKD